MITAWVIFSERMPTSIAPAIADSLFESFVTTKGGGMGVGLAICKQIVEAYGGSIHAGKSARLGGAAFRFTLPISSESETAGG